MSGKFFNRNIQKLSANAVISWTTYYICLLYVKLQFVVNYCSAHAHVRMAAKILLHGTVLALVNACATDTRNRHVDVTAVNVKTSKFHGIQTLSVCAYNNRVKSLIAHPIAKHITMNFLTQNEQQSSLTVQKLTVEFNLQKN